MNFAKRLLQVARSIRKSPVAVMAVVALLLLPAVVFVTGAQGQTPTAPPAFPTRPIPPLPNPARMPANVTPHPYSESLAGRNSPPPKEPVGANAVKPNGAQLKGRFLPQLESMVDGLRVALGDPPPCQSLSCNHVQGFVQNLELTRDLCLTSYPGGLIAEYGNDPTVGNTLRAFQRACDSLNNSLRSLGAPADSPAWRNAASAVLQIAQPVAIAERARSP